MQVFAAQSKSCTFQNRNENYITRSTKQAYLLLTSYDMHKIYVIKSK